MQTQFFSKKHSSLTCLLLNTILGVFFCVPSSKLGTLWEGDRGFVTCPSVCLSVCLSVCPSVAKRSAQTAHWILIKFGMNMQEGMGMPPLLFIFS